MYYQLMTACPEKVTGHRLAHDAQADESNGTHAGRFNILHGNRLAAGSMRSGDQQEDDVQQYR